MRKESSVVGGVTAALRLRHCLQAPLCMGVGAWEGDFCFNQNSYDFTDVT